MPSVAATSPPPSVHSANSDAEDSSDEWQLLDDSSDEGEDNQTQNRISKHDIITAPLFTREALGLLITKFNDASTQYGVLGRVLGIHNNDQTVVPPDQRLYINTNAPFSAIICGVQGSGKSHTLSTILENMLIPNFSPIGKLEKALCGMVLHYGEAGKGSLPNETAWLCSSASSHVQGPPIRVFVSHSSLNTMRKVYAPLGEKVVVEPLYFRRKELDAQAVLSMMAVSSSESAPLYMQIVLTILRELGENYSFKKFMDSLSKSKEKFNPAQLSGLEQRMALLTSFLDPDEKLKKESRARWNPGQLTIVDLSDPFLDEAAACGIFDILVRLFVRTDVQTGKVLVVDEAHKYLSPGRAASGLTKTLLRVVRQQRHLSMRVLISTQEPTVVPAVLIDLCSVTILHRFTSPSWWTHLTHHVSADFSKGDAFDQVVKLKTGQAIVLAPAGLGELSNGGTEKADASEIVGHIGRRYLIMKTRRRVTMDGGASILATS